MADAGGKQQEPTGASAPSGLPRPGRRERSRRDAPGPVGPELDALIEETLLADAVGSDSEHPEHAPELPPPTEAAAAPDTDLWAELPVGTATFVERLLATVPLGVAVVDCQRRFVRVNDAFAQITGVAPRDHERRTVDEVLGPRAPLVEDHLTRVLDLGESVCDERVSGELPGTPGETRYACVTYEPLRSDSDEVSGALILVADITRRVMAATERSRSAADQALLSEAARMLAESLDATATLRELARLLVPRLADVCAVYLVQADGRLKRAALAPGSRRGRTRVKRAIETIGAMHGARGDGEKETVGMRVLAARGSMRLTGEAAVGNDDRGCYLVAPLVARGAAVGTLVVGSTEGARELDDEHVHLVEQIAARAALAIDNARLHDAERQARADAEAASHAKSAFLAMMSHEIRTPINAVMGYTELLEMGIAGPLTLRQREQLGRIRASSRHLLSLVNDVLDLAKVEAGRLRVQREQEQAPHSVLGALALVQPQAEARGILLSNLCAGDGGPRYMGDPHRVEQILVNLLSNAIRFTPPAGRVTVRCDLIEQARPPARMAVGTDCVCALHVQDTGIGIAPEHLATIFEPFVQVDSGHTRAREGSGLGLAISRRLARLMGGDLTAVSTPEHGSTFTLWLPGVPTVTPDGHGECAIPERREPARRARGLIAIGEMLLHEVERITGRYLSRIREEHREWGGRRLSDTQLLDHTATFVTDVALALAIIEESGGAPTRLMRDGTEIQRVIADRHGRMRRQVGYSERQLEREYVVLREEMEHTIRESASTLPGAEEALSLVRVFLTRARETSVEAYRRAE